MSRAQLPIVVLHTDHYWHIFSVDHWCDLEIWVRGHSRSLPCCQELRQPSSDAPLRRGSPRMVAIYGNKVFRCQCYNVVQKNWRKVEPYEQGAPTSETTDEIAMT